MIFWIVEYIFFHFLRQQSTAASGNSSFFNWIIFFRQFFIPASGNELFVFQRQYCFILLVEIIMETWEKSIIKDELYSC